MNLPVTDPAEPDYFPPFIDATMLRDFRNCPQRFYNSHILRIVPRDAEAPDLVAGGAFAKGLEVTRTSYYARNKPFDDALADGLRALTLDYGEQDFYDYKGNDHKKCYLNTAAALVYYFDAYPVETDPIQPYFTETGIPAIEFSFAIPLPINHPQTDLPLLYSGRLDMLGIFHDSLWIVDEKTTSQLGAHWSSSWDLRSQFLGYTWAAEQHGYTISGSIVRGICFLMHGYKNGEAIMPYKQYLVERWYQQMLRDVDRMIRCYHEGYFDYNLDDSCHALYGGCPYRPLCGVLDPAPWIAGDYVERRWNPLLQNPAGNLEEEANVA